MRPSLALCVLNYTIVSLTVLALSSGYVTSGSSFVVGVLFYPFGVFTTLVFIPAPVGVIVGIDELRSRPTKVLSVIAILSNLMLMIAYVIAVKALWPALMGI